MKKILLFAFTIFIILACGNRVVSTEAVEVEEEQSSTVRTIVDPQNRQDTVYFGYILGQHTKAITDSLIDDRKMDVEHRLTFSISKGEVTQEIYVEGYPFNLYVADKKYKALLTLFDTEGQKISLFNDKGRLMSQQIYIQGRERGPIIEALKEQYGEPNTPPEDGYKSFVPYEDMDAFWNVSNKAVYLATLGNFMVLVYEDIIAIRERRCSEAEALDREKRFNMEQSRNTKF